MTATTKRTNPRATKKYRALIAADFSDAEALGYLAGQGVDVSHVTPKDESLTPEAQLLVDAGFKPEDALKLDASQPKRKKGKKAKKAKAKKVEVVNDLNAKDAGEALVAQRGLAFTSGRVYVNPAIVEAQVRVLKGGKPEVVATSGVGRTAAVLVFATDSGDAAVQNLRKPV